MPILDSARRLITTCEAVYKGDLSPTNDITSVDNTVAKYAEADIQKKYVHMYFAKYVGCWRAIRRRLGVHGPHRLVSIGAGPLLCCMGWLWDNAPHNEDVAVQAYDVLDWQGVRMLPEFEALWAQTGVNRLDYQAARYIPDGEPPPQAAIIPGLLPISVAEIGTGNVVLLPYILNHVLGLSGPINTAGQRRLFAWIEGVRQAGNMVVIADMLHRYNTAGFWRSVTVGLGAPGGRDNLNFEFAADATNSSQAYGQHQAGRRAGLIPDSTKGGVLYGSATTPWTWLV